jgi:hypothetical protein
MSAMDDLNNKLYSADSGMTRDLFNGKELHATNLIDQISRIFSTMYIKGKLASQFLSS